MAHISEAAPLQISRFYTGWYSYRNPLIVPIKQMGRRLIELYDALADGLNMEPSNRLTLKRRPGYVALPNLVNGKAQFFYSFKPSSFPGQIYQVVDSTADIEWYRLDPNQANQVLWIKETSSLTTFATVGAYLYMAHEQWVHQKWDAPGGIQGITNWGIDIQSAGFNPGPRPPTTGTNLTSTQPVPSPWQNPGAIVAQDGALATVTLTRAPDSGETVTSGWLGATGFGFAFSVIPHDLEIRGFQVQLFGLNVTGATQDVGVHVRMLKNGKLYGCFRTVTLPTKNPFINLGRPNDTWDGTWTPKDVNDPGFGVAIQAVSSSDTPATFSIDAVKIVVSQVGKPATAQGTPTGGEIGFATEVGVQYQYTYGNSHSGHMSSPTPPSFWNVTGNSAPMPVGNALATPPTLGVGIVTLEVSPDPQVNEIHVFRTTDGGGWPFFELPNSPFPNVGDPNNPRGPNFIDIRDDSPDNNLQIANICPDPHQNDPPAGGAVDPVWYAGRLWMHRGHQLFFSTGPDVNMGNGSEAWYPVYVFSIPSGQIVRKFATPNGLLVFTHDEILIVRGISTFSFTVNDFAKDIGMRVWTAGDSDGTNIYFYTSDRQFLLLDPGGFHAIAANISDQIKVIDPKLAHVAMFRYGADINDVFVADGSTFLYPYNQELTAWAVREKPVQGVEAIGTIEFTPGVFQFWRGHSLNGQSRLSQRDTTGQIFMDEGEPYPCHAIFGSLPLADFLTLAQVRDLAYCHAATSSEVLLSVIANEIFPIAGKQFEILQISSTEPPELSATPSISFHANRYTWKSAPLPEHVNFIFHRIDFSPDPNPDELFNWTLGGTQTTGGSSLGAPGQLPQLQGR